MILVDTNIFIIDRFFPRDDHYQANKAFVDKMDEINAAFSVYNYFELLGLASFNLNENEFKRWFFEFDEVYPVEILYPPNLDESLRNHFKWIQKQLFKNMTKEMTYVDALTLILAEWYNARALVTWNIKDFKEKSKEIDIFNPQEFLKHLDKKEKGNQDRDAK